MKCAYVLAGLLLLTCAQADENPLPLGLLPLDGKAMKALKLADMDGQVTDLKALQGRWVLVHFWATWCGPCREEMPSLQALAKQIPAERLVLVLVNTAETDEDVFAFLGVVAPDLNSLMDRDGQVTERWQPRGLPASFLIDPQGRRRYLALGGRDWDSPSYLAFLRKLVGVSAP